MAIIDSYFTGNEAEDANIAYKLIEEKFLAKREKINFIDRRKNSVVGMECDGYLLIFGISQFFFMKRYTVLSFACTEDMKSHIAVPKVPRKSRLHDLLQQVEDMYNEVHG